MREKLNMDREETERRVETETEKRRHRQLLGTKTEEGQKNRKEWRRG